MRNKIIIILLIGIICIPNFTLANNPSFMDGGGIGGGTGLGTGIDETDEGGVGAEAGGVIGAGEGTGESIGAGEGTGATTNNSINEGADNLGTNANSTAQNANTLTEKQIIDQCKSDLKKKITLKIPYIMDPLINLACGIWAGLVLTLTSTLTHMINNLLIF